MPTSPNLAATPRKPRVHRGPVARDRTQLALWVLLVLVEIVMVVSFAASRNGHRLLWGVILACASASAAALMAVIIGRLLRAGDDQA